ncbi:MAG: gluconokinase [Alphaproteobacteria bacterium]
MSMAASQPVSDPPRLIVIMGVAGCGKTTIGKALAAKLQAVFLDGDHFHPPRNIEKMSRGDPLTDEDRWPWLDRFAMELATRHGTVVGGCSALRRIYRERITTAADEPVLFVHLVGDSELIAQRMAVREGHFMPLSLLQSQFATLEPPDDDEYAISASISGTADDIVSEICADLDRVKIPQIRLTSGPLSAPK